MSRKKNYDFITKAGKKFQTFIFRFCEKMFHDESFPAEFLDTMLHMILKGSASRKEVLSRSLWHSLRYIN